MAQYIIVFNQEGNNMPSIIDDAILVAWNSARTGAAALLSGYEILLLDRYHGPPSKKEKDFEEEAEKAIRKIITDAFPDHPIYTKDSDLMLQGGGDLPSPRWYVDSLDGAFNFLRNSPFFSISICFAGKDDQGEDRPLIGVIIAPVLMEMFWAIYGGGAHHCQQIPGIGITEGPIYVSDAGKTAGAVVKTGLNSSFQEGREGFIKKLSQMQKEVGALCRDASASLNMAYVAAGRAEGYFDSGVATTAVAAGYLLVSEAGGMVSDYQGRPFRLEESQDILVSNRLLHGKLVEILGSSS
jgi:myo-inositol-1(or 4)-monophosphatase